MILPKVSFRLKLIIFLEILFISINTLMGFFVWRQLSSMVREISRSKLKAIAASTASLIDTNSHEKLLDKSDKDTPDYIKVQTVMKKIMVANDQVDDIYTLRRTSQDNIWTFVVSAAGTEDSNQDGTIEATEEQVAIGEKFDATNCPQLATGWDAPAADRDINCDQWGCWLSGYAPVKNGDGTTIAVAGVDIAANDIFAYEKNLKIIILASIIFLTALLPLLLNPLLIILLRPVSTIVGGLKAFGQNLSSRIHVNSQDEFELIASTFNDMAGQLQDLYQDLEKKVKEKTGQLNKKIDELEESKAKDEAIIDSIGEGLMAIDKKKKIILINRQMPQLLETSDKKILRKDYARLVKLTNEKGLLVPEKNDPVRIALEHGQKNTLTCLLQKDQSSLPVALTASPVVQGRSIIGVIVIFRDMTEEKEIEKAKSEFVSLAAHQLRTPLATINWYCERLLEEKTDNLTHWQKQYLGDISQVTEKMVSLVNNFLNVSRIEMGTFLVQPKPTDLKELANDVLKELQPQIQEKKIKLETAFDNPIKKFSADPKLLRVVFQNLLTNAIKYTPPAGKVSFRIYLDKEEVVCEISDSGYGIPFHQQDKIFTKLFRADNVKGMEVDGNGLGLYITKSIIDHSNGKIYFSSQEGKGTTFFIRFPSAGMRNQENSFFSN